MQGMQDKKDEVKHWVRNTVLKNVKRDECGNYVFPDVLDDWKKLWRIHSWYKHLRAHPIKVYPILKLEGQGELRWTFVPEHLLFGNSREYFPIEIMVDHGIYLLQEYGDFALERNNRDIVVYETGIVEERIRRLLYEMDDKKPKKVENRFYWCLDGGHSNNRDVKIKDPELELEQEDGEDTTSLAEELENMM